MSTSKPRVIQNFEKLSQELQEQIKLVYPEGFSQHLIKFTNAKGEKVSALPFETDDRIYMVRMSVETAKAIIADDEDYDDDGNLRDDVREKYEGEHADVDYLDMNDNYDGDEEDSDDKDDTEDDDDER